MLPPKRVWIQAPTFTMRLRDRTVMPRTTPRLDVIRYPSKPSAVVTHSGWMDMARLLCDASCPARSFDRRVRARLYYPRSMARAFEKTTLSDAVGRLRSGMKVLLPAGCGDAVVIRDEILRQADRLAPLTLMGGLRLDDYPFAGPAYA